MKAVLLESGSPETCQPVCCARPLSACLVGTATLRAAQEERVAAAGMALAAGASRGALRLWLAGDAWLSPALLQYLGQSDSPCVVRDAVGAALAWVGGTAQPPETAAPLPPDGSSYRIRYPWDLLRIHEELLGALTADHIVGDVSPAAHVEGRLWLGRGSRILPGVYVEGNVVIGADCKIGPNAYLRGCTTIGNGCHIGQAVEVKNSIVMDGCSLGHLSYCGDSILGEHVNFGAGTITANFRHDGRDHRSMVNGVLVETGRRKFGAVVGDHVHTGIHTSLYPGRKLWPNTWTRPGAIVDRDLRPE
jgi:acetyltransferase-like isoleucine patch superfamily enzyme